MPKISMTLKLMLGLLLGSLVNLIEKTSDTAIYPLLKNSHVGLKRTVDALSDNDPNDKEQMKAIAGQLAYESSKDYNNYLKEEYVSKLDASLQAGVNFTLDKAVSVIGILTDSNPDNKAQLKQFVEDNDVEGVLILKDALLSKIQDKEGDFWPILKTMLENAPWEEIVDPS